MIKLTRLEIKTMLLEDHDFSREKIRILERVKENLLVKVSEVEKKIQLLKQQLVPVA